MILSTSNSKFFNLNLKNDEVHAWRATLDQPEYIIRQLAQTLSTDEKNKADRYYYEKDRRHFIVGRGILRAILGLYLGIIPNQLSFRYGGNGKPELSDKVGQGVINFNLSHSGNFALYVFTRKGRIGADIECIRVIPEMELIAERFFSVSENNIIRKSPLNKRKEAFFNCWTCKEALIKASGDGFAKPLNTFKVDLTPDKTNEFVSITGKFKENSQWSLLSLRPASGYVGAIAVEGHDRYLRYFILG